MAEATKIKTERLNPDQLIDLFEESKFENIVGVEETPQIDFKREFYDLKTEDKQFEFAKDIAAIANSKGGLICVGFENGEDPEKLVSYAKSLTPMGKLKLDQKQLTQTLKNKIVPRLPEKLVSYKFYGDNNEYLVIEINETPSELMPFLVAKKNNQMEYFLCPFRNGADTETFLHTRKIHEYISTGYQKGTAKDKNELQEVNSKLDVILEKMSESTGDEDDMPGVLQKYLDYAKDKIESKTGFFYMLAVPTNPVILSNFWSKDKNIIYDLLSGPPHLRTSGWDMSVATNYGEAPYPIADRWESMNGSRKLNIVDNKGNIFTAGAIEGFLDWGNENHRTSEKYEGTLVNNFALVEYIDAFAHFLSVFDEMNLSFADYQIQVGFILPEEIKINLLRPFHIAMYNPSIIGPNVATEVKVTVTHDEKLEPKYIAGRIVEAVNASIFSNTHSLAYLGSDEAGAFVDEERYKNAN